MAAYRRVYDSRLTAKNREPERNPSYSTVYCTRELHGDEKSPRSHGITVNLVPVPAMLP